MVEIRKQVKTTNQSGKNSNSNSNINNNNKSGGSQRPKVQIILKGSQAASRSCTRIEGPGIGDRGIQRGHLGAEEAEELWPRLPSQTHFEKGQHEIPGESLTRLRLVTFLGKVFVESWTVTEFCRFFFLFLFFSSLSATAREPSWVAAIRWRRAEQTSFVGGNQRSCTSKRSARGDSGKSQVHWII